MSIKLARDALFVYGSLLDEAKRMEIIGRQVEVVVARLDGFERRRGRYFYVVRETNASTAGLILLDLRAEDLGRLDAYEDVPYLYTREEIEVDSINGPLRCWVYLPTTRCIEPREKKI